MKLILNPKLKEHTVLGWEWFEPISYGYDNKGILQSILCKAGHKDGSLPPYDVVDLVDIQEPELSEDLMMFYTVSTTTNEQPEEKHHGIICPHCNKFLDFSYGFEEASAVGCLYCRAEVPVSNELMVTLTKAKGQHDGS